MASFNKKKKFDEYVKPILDQLERECKIRGIPMFTVLCTKCSEKGDAVFETAAVPTGSNGIRLNNDMILKHIMLQKDNGSSFDIVPRTTQISMDYETVDGDPLSDDELIDESEL